MYLKSKGWDDMTTCSKLSLSKYLNMMQHCLHIVQSPFLMTKLLNDFLPNEFQKSEHNFKTFNGNIIGWKLFWTHCATDDLVVNFHDLIEFLISFMKPSFIWGTVCHGKFLSCTRPFAFCQMSASQVPIWEKLGLKLVCTYRNECPDQPAQLHNLIRTFVSLLMNQWTDYIKVLGPFSLAYL